jgi:hypothetical protein
VPQRGAIGGFPVFDDVEALTICAEPDAEQEIEDADLLLPSEGLVDDDLAHGAVQWGGAGGDRSRPRGGGCRGRPGRRLKRGITAEGRDE